MLIDIRHKVPQADVRLRKADPEVVGLHANRVATVSNFLDRGAASFRNVQEEGVVQQVLRLGRPRHIDIVIDECLARVFEECMENFFRDV